MVSEVASDKASEVALEVDIGKQGQSAAREEVESEVLRIAVIPQSQ